ncbi:uncharacterized protein LOC141665902 [Apium graveolens]|uniref:uncharacterized protein LOC141665902 n=1 Tax=Apium graveolens TaxID=4045 RepID=UPI003D79C893
MRDYNERRRDQDDQGRNPQPRGPVINMIFGGTTAAGSSRNIRKAYTREVMHITGEAPKRTKTGVSMEFNHFDLEGVKFPHDDPLVITPIKGNISVKRVLVGNRALLDILLYDTNIRMGYTDLQLTPYDMPIYGFKGIKCPIKGKIKLPLMMGQEPRQARQMCNFVVLKARSTYHAIMGRTGIHAFMEVPSSYHSIIKFPTRNGIGEERGDQKKARNYYVVSLRADGAGRKLPMKTWTSVRMIRNEESHQGI